MLHSKPKHRLALALLAALAMGCPKAEPPPLDDASADADVPLSPDADVPLSPDADADVQMSPDADVLMSPDVDVPPSPDADVPPSPDADVPPSPDADVPPSPDVDVPPPPDVPPTGPVVRGGVAPGGVHVSSTVRVRGALSLASRICNPSTRVCIHGGISP